MRPLAAAVVLGIAVTSAAAHEASAAAVARAAALQEHRAAAHRAPEHHLQEARRALDRASDKASKTDRQALEPLRADFAALALAYAKLPTEPRSADGSAPAAAGAAASHSTHESIDVPPKTTAVTPPSATSTEPLAGWQQKYADVERDLKAFGTDDRVLRTRVDHVRTHLQMFYAAALGKQK